MKKLYLFTSNNGDGSASIKATFNAELIAEMEEKYNSEDSSFDFERWADGDGFHYMTLNVPDECSAQSMGFSEITREQVFF